MLFRSWIPGSYDPQLNLFYIGTAQAKPWVAASRGMSPKDAALYTNSTLALDPMNLRQITGRTRPISTSSAVPSAARNRPTTRI